MLSLSFVPLVGGFLPFFFSAVQAKPASFAVSIRGAGVQFVDGPITSDNLGVTTTNGNIYTTDITLGGLNLTVNLDTGSSDLVVIRQGRDINLTNSSDIQANETFGVGQATGVVNFADLQMGDFIVQSQAFFDVTQAKDLEAAGDGVIGLSFNAPSSVFNAVAKQFSVDVAVEFASTPLPALFSQRPDLPRSFDVLLGRADGLGDPAQGVFLISDHDEDFQQVTDAPPLTSVSGDHWSVVLDAMNINGKPFEFNQSRIQGMPAGKVAAVLDTGFSFPPLPPPAVDAIYSSIEGAVFDKNMSLWVVPCNASGVSLSFVMGGDEFFVHPLDLTSVVSGPIGPDPSTNITICINTFQYLTLDPAEFTGFDLILGDAFLRNVYASFNYGDANTNPFVQLVSTTPDPAKALQEFEQQRPATLAKLAPAPAPSDVANKEGQAKQAPANGSNGSDGSSSPSSGSGSPQSPGATQSATSAGASGTPTGQAAKPNGARRGGAVGASVLGALALLSGVFLL